MRANRALISEINTLQAESQGAAISPGKLSGKNSEANELILLRNRIVQLKARPNGVVDSAMKSRAEWRNVGRATPAAALETLLWAFYVKDLDIVADSHAFNESDRRILDTWFASFSDAVRARYGTPERLLAPMDGELSRYAADPAVAFQIIDQQEDHGPSAVKITYWERLASGKELQASIGLTENGSAGWQASPSGSGMSDSQWKTMVFSQIDPATGGIITPAP
jgi:hypothetical protein